MDKYIWLIKHLIWNAPSQKGRTFWIKIPKEDAEILSKEYEIVETRTLKGGISVNVVNILNNFIVLDTR